MPQPVATRPRAAPADAPDAASASDRRAPASLADLLARGSDLDVVVDPIGRARAAPADAPAIGARALARALDPGARAGLRRALMIAGAARVRVALSHRTDHGGERWLETTITPIDDGLRIVVKDITSLVALGRQVGALRAERDALRRLVHTEDDDPALARAAADVARLMGGARAVISRGPPGEVGADQVWAAGAADPDPAASFATPVRIGGRIWGTLAIAALAGERLAGAEERLEAVADVLGVAIAGAQARARIAALDDRDPLTGLANHRAFYRALERIEQAGDGLALALVDVDAFRDVNRAHGHERADRALIELARRLRGAAAPAQLVARIGGADFAWLLPGLDAPGALRLIEAARADLCGSALAGIAPVRLSVGVSDLEIAGTGAELIRQADAALREAKLSGRNRSRVYRLRMGVFSDGRQVAEAAARATSLRALRALARAADAKDPSTQRHSSRVADLAGVLAADLGWSAGRIAQLREAALLHDVGKIGVPDRVLFKRGRLTRAEYERVKQHAAIGAEIASEALSAEQASWVRYHHERWDGHGYPEGLAAERIPQGARLLAAADTWDAMTRFRHYRRPAAPKQAIAECRREAGAQLDPVVVVALVQAWERGVLISEPASEVPFPRLPPSEPPTLLTGP